jgi:radical SAM superfamily enzyme YgiQ (UPF0313 family)
MVPHMSTILLTTINATWIHPSLALRLLKANLGEYEHEAEILEFALRQPLSEKVEPILAADPRILGISVAIWNHTATKELLDALCHAWGQRRPIVVLGGPEASSLDEDAPLFRYADYVVRGEGELAFRELCERILKERQGKASATTHDRFYDKFIVAEPVDLAVIDPGYRLYTQEDLTKKFTYIEASRGCPFGCEFCMSSLDKGVRFFPLTPFLENMETLLQRGAHAFKFLDRTFNMDIFRAQSILEFFLARLGQDRRYIHVEMVPSVFPVSLREVLTRFTHGSLRLEVGIQTFNAKTATLINRKSDPDKELETLSFLRRNTAAIIHADLIAGLPGEDFASFARGFDQLLSALSDENQRFARDTQDAHKNRTEIQLGILKCLPGTPIARHAGSHGLRFSKEPPYEVLETSALSKQELDRIKNFARFWELLVNRSAVSLSENRYTFGDFMRIADKLLEHFGRNWGIDKKDLVETFNSIAAVQN